MEKRCQVTGKKPFSENNFLPREYQNETPFLTEFAKEMFFSFK